MNEALAAWLIRRYDLGPPIWSPTVPTGIIEPVQHYSTLSGLGKISRGHFFDNLYGLDVQIEIMLSAVQAAIDSGMRNRFHALLYGVPGCGKTEALNCLAMVLLDKNVDFLSLDSTSTTEAGLRKRFLEDDMQAPDVIMIEELEKVPPQNLRWLLGVLDRRATITQVNYRKTASKRIPAIVLATANDLARLGRMHAGALLSRFQVKIAFPRPTRALLAKILAREITTARGNYAWIEPTLIYAFDQNQITDPRAIIPICLAGKDRLLDGSYQKYLDLTKVD